MELVEYVNHSTEPTMTIVAANYQNAQLTEEASLFQMLRSKDAQTGQELMKHAESADQTHAH